MDNGHPYPLTAGTWSVCDAQLRNPSCLRLTTRQIHVEDLEYATTYYFKCFGRCLVLAAVCLDSAQGRSDGVGSSNWLHDLHDDELRSS